MDESSRRRPGHRQRQQKVELPKEKKKHYRHLHSHREPYKPSGSDSPIRSSSPWSSSFLKYPQKINFFILFPSFLLSLLISNKTPKIETLEIRFSKRKGRRKIRKKSPSSRRRKKKRKQQKLGLEMDAKLSKN